MPEFKEAVTKSQESAASETGAEVQQQTHKVATDVTADSKQSRG